ncbi:methyl-accepting chemotaxis protein [Paenibacillus endoradicis]|uniref:methyl-accepting chemotaxis protein n=1 Tax=Paenibacillus endoradicis TaxID=2972487 RepID=UPI0021598FF1|nr:methyl-accepting chemotaxis protein [Paenibacillus endoradicis]MCR8658850.1 methyl-accepting chemotaxis protein [Paenibacillus endoradicis]
MLSTLLKPFTSLVSRMKYGQKFIFISILFLAPIIYLFTTWAVDQQKDIEYLNGEQVGVMQIEEVWPLAIQIQQHRGLVSDYLNGNTQLLADIKAKQAEIEDVTDSIDEKFNKELYPQSYKQYQSILNQWSNIERTFDQYSAAESYNMHSDLVKEVLVEIKLLSDESYLTLDTEIDTYYMMRLLVNELPMLIETTGVIRGQGNATLMTGQLSDEAYLQLQLKKALSDDTGNEIVNTIGRLNTSHPGKYTQLLDQLKNVHTMSDNFIALLDNEILNVDSFTISTDDYFNKGTAVISEMNKAYVLLGHNMTDQLQSRIDSKMLSRNIALAIMVIIFLFIMLIYLSFYRNVIETVKNLKERAEAMAKGNFSQDIVLNTKDELREVGEAFNSMQRAMSIVLENNQNIAKTTLGSSSQLAAIAQESSVAMKQVAESVQQVSDGTVRQTRTTSETAKAMNEMAIGVNRIAEAASEVAFVAIRASENALLGDQQLTETVKQMDSIKKSQDLSAGVVRRLEEHSAQISKIIDAIMDIASQTKLLALNANIEAARAGEYGRGFTVVAQEVGKLAEETTSSGKSISQLLGEIRGLVNENVEAMKSMQIETNSGLESVHRSKNTIDRILEDIRIVSGQIQDVSATSEEMSAEMQEVTSSIAEVAHISELNSNEAETMAAAAEEQLASMEQIEYSAKELKQVSAQLQDDLSKFILQSTE